MPRFAILAGLAALALGAATASAQDMGGVTLAPEIMAMDNAQGRVLDHVLARTQQLQQLRLLSGTPAISSNLANPAFAPPNGGPTATGTSPDSALALASALRQRAAQSSDPGGQAIFQQQIVNNSQSLTVNNPLTVNATDSPVVLGNNNVVKQQVTSSTAITTNGNATASAGASSTNGGPAPKTRKGKSGQIALSNAASLGGAAHAVASNIEVAPEANR
jgi:hypothetical protein